MYICNVLITSYIPNNVTMNHSYQNDSYRTKLFDRRWQTKRQEILDRDHNTCILCGETSHLVVHHKQYHFVTRLARFREPWEYDSRYLITLCKDCHEKGHNKFEVPIMKL